MHEAFAAQVASNIQALESETWAREKLGRPPPVGEVDRDRLNVNGGSIALGHPFGATGRAHHDHPRERDEAARARKFGLLSVCAQGGHGLRHGAGAMRRRSAMSGRPSRGRRDEDGVLVLTLDVPGEKVNTLGKGLIAELRGAARASSRRTRRSRPSSSRSGKPDNFIAGADIKDFTQIRSAEEGEALSRARPRDLRPARERCACRWWRPSTAPASAAAPSWRWPAATAWPPTTRRPRSACPR